MMGPPSPQTSEETTEETVDLPGFRPLPLPPPLDDLDPETTRVTTEEGTTGDDGDGGPSDGDGSTSTPRSTSSRGSTPDPAGLQAIIEAGLNLLSMAVRWVRQRSFPVELPRSTWTLDAYERESIAVPLARIVERRSPAGEVSADVVDGIAAGTGAVAHGMRSLGEEGQVVDYLRAEGYVPGGDPQADDAS